MGNSALGRGTALEENKVKGSSGDLTPDFLDGKVDGTSITVTANALTTIDGGIDHNSLNNTHNLGSDVDHDATTNFVANEHVDHSSVNVNTNALSGLSGGGDLTASRSLLVDPNNATDVTITASDEILFADADDSSNLKKDTVQGILDLVPAGGSGFVEVFDTGGTWTCPTGVNYIEVTMCGGGGGGGGGRSNSPHNSGTGGGAGGAIVGHVLRVTPASTYAVGVGAAGTGGPGGAAAGVNGGAGGNSTFVSDDHTLTAFGGGGGFGGQSSDQDVVGAGGASAIDDQVMTSLTDIVTAPGPNASRIATTYSPFAFPGGDGGDSNTDSSRDGGAGGNSFFAQGGNGGDFQSPTLNAEAGKGIGAGGGGGRGTGGPGGDGGEGIVIIKYAVNGTPS